MTRPALERGGGRLAAVLTPQQQAENVAEVQSTIHQRCFRHADFDLITLADCKAKSLVKCQTTEWWQSIRQHKVII